MSIVDTVISNFQNRTKATKPIEERIIVAVVANGDITSMVNELLNSFKQAAGTSIPRTEVGVRCLNQFIGFTQARNYSYPLALTNLIDREIPINVGMSSVSLSYVLSNLEYQIKPNKVNTIFLVTNCNVFDDVGISISKLYTNVKIVIVTTAGTAGTITSGPSYLNIKHIVYNESKKRSTTRKPRVSTSISPRLKSDPSYIGHQVSNRFVQFTVPGSSSSMVRIDTFINNRINNNIRVKKAVGTTYIVGRAFYQLTKPEIVSPDKEIVIRRQMDGNIFEGKFVRSLLGIPKDYTIKLLPNAGAYRGYDIFVQSTSPNRLLAGKTDVLYLKRPD